MAEILSKSEFAAKLGVNLSAVSNYIARGKLTAPALRPDGTVDLELAMRQLRTGLDLARSTGLGAPGAAAIVGPWQPIERPEELSEQRTHGAGARRLRRRRGRAGTPEAQPRNRQVPRREQVAGEWRTPLPRSCAISRRASPKNLHRSSERAGRTSPCRAYRLGITNRRHKSGSLAWPRGQ